MSFAAAAAVARPDVVDAFQRFWTRLASPGATWSGSERVDIARVARAARSHEPIPDVELPAAAIAAARVMGGEPATANEQWIDDEMVPTIGYAAYVEIVGLVSQFIAVDSYHRAMGLPLEPLPDPIAGDPTGDIAEGAKKRSSWVPTEGGSSVVFALTLVPQEAVGFEDLHGPLYIPPREMGDDHFARHLNRPQMELVAARTSAINDCFY